MRGAGLVNSRGKRSTLNIHWNISGGNTSDWRGSQTTPDKTNSGTENTSVQVRLGFTTCFWQHVLEGIVYNL